MKTIDLNGTVVVVSGSSQGLGRTMAMGLADAGARVVLASPDAAGLDGVADEIGRDKALAVVADITSQEDCRRILSDATGAFGGIDVLVNNARCVTIGQKKGPFWEGSTDFWEQSIHVNIFGTFLLSHTLAPHMIERGWGRIINITTSLDTIQRVHNAPYGVTKAAMEAETMIWAKDLAATGVSVNSLIPGGSCDTGVPGSRMGRSDKVLLDPVVLVPPVIWLSSSLSDGKTGGRYVGKDWDVSLPPSEAAAAAMEPPIFVKPAFDRG